MDGLACLRLGHQLLFDKGANAVHMTALANHAHDSVDPGQLLQRLKAQPCAVIKLNTQAAVDGVDSHAQRAAALKARTRFLCKQPIVSYSSPNVQTLVSITYRCAAVSRRICASAAATGWRTCPCRRPAWAWSRAAGTAPPAGRRLARQRCPASTCLEMCTMRMEFRKASVPLLHPDARDHVVHEAALLALSSRVLHHTHHPSAPFPAAYLQFPSTCANP